MILAPGELIRVRDPFATSLNTRIKVSKHDTFLRYLGDEGRQLEGQDAGIVISSIGIGEVIKQHEEATMLFILAADCMGWDSSAPWMRITP